MKIPILPFLMTAAIMLVIPSCKEKQAVPDDERVCLIMDTDIGNDVDDALALDMLYKYMDAGEIDLLAINVSKEGDGPAECIDIFNTWYGYPDIPVGVVRNSPYKQRKENFAQTVVDLKDEQGNPLFHRSGIEYEKLPDAEKLYRKVLAAQKQDHSVVIVSVGFFTNLSRLLQSGPDEYSDLSGKELVERKVDRLVVMAGCFDDPSWLEYNVVKDIPSAQSVFRDWPGEIYASPFELGKKILYPGESIEHDFDWAGAHPVVEAYKDYLPMPYDRPTWDPTAVLFAVEGPEQFIVSPPGRIEVTEEGSTFFTPEEGGNHHYLMVNEDQTRTIREHFIHIITSHPLNRQEAALPES